MLGGELMLAVRQTNCTQFSPIHVCSLVSLIKLHVPAQVCAYTLQTGLAHPIPHRLIVIDSKRGRQPSIREYIVCILTLR